MLTHYNSSRMSSAYFKKEIQERNTINNDSLRKKNFLKRIADILYIAQRYLLSVFVLVRNN